MTEIPSAVLYKGRAVLRLRGLSSSHPALLVDPETKQAHSRRFPTSTARSAIEYEAHPVYPPRSSEL